MVITSGVLPMFFFYDINCRYKAHALAFAGNAVARGLLTREQALWITMVMAFPLPPWHHYMHNLFCQRRNSLRNMKWGGTGHGEPMEIFWSRIRGLGILWQYASLPAREVALERSMLLWNRSKLEKLPHLLGSMFNRAKLKKEEAESRIKLVQTAMDEAVAMARARSPEEGAALEAAVAEVLRNPPDVQLEGVAAELPWESRYVQLLKIEATIESTAAATGRSLPLDNTLTSIGTKSS